jgi:hypothetical protein
LSIAGCSWCFTDRGESGNHGKTGKRFGNLGALLGRLGAAEQLARAKRLRDTSRSVVPVLFLNSIPALNSKEVSYIACSRARELTYMMNKLLINHYILLIIFIYIRAAANLQRFGLLKRTPRKNKKMFLMIIVTA